MRTLARGLAGRLLAGYHVAAHLGAWDLAIGDDAMLDGDWRLTAEVRRTDPYWLGHGSAFGLELALGPACWRWRDVAVEPGASITVRGHGPPQVSDAA